MNGKIVLFGTHHPLQMNRKSADKSHRYQETLKRVCRKHEIQLIAEEVSLGDYEYYDYRTRSLALQVAKDLGLYHDMSDLSYKEDSILKCADHNFMLAADFFGQEYADAHLREVFSSCIMQPLRERYWYARILDCCVRLNVRSVLFVCGGWHVSRMHDLIQSTGMPVVISHECYGVSSLVFRRLFAESDALCNVPINRVFTNG